MKNKTWGWIILGVTAIIAVASLAIAWRLQQEEQITEEEAAAGEETATVSGQVYGRSLDNSGVISEDKKIPIAGVELEIAQWKSDDDFQVISGIVTDESGNYTATVSKGSVIAVYISSTASISDSTTYGGVEYDLSIVKEFANTETRSCALESVQAKGCSIASGSAPCGEEHEDLRTTQLGQSYENCGVLADQDQITNMDFTFKDPTPQLIPVSGKIIVNTVDDKEAPIEGVEIEMTQWQLVYDPETQSLIDYAVAVPVGQTNSAGEFSTKAPNYGSIGMSIISLDDVPDVTEFEGNSYDTSDLKEIQATNCQSSIFETTTGCWLNEGQASCSTADETISAMGQYYSNCNTPGNVLGITDLDFHFTEKAGFATSSELSCDSKTASDTTPKVGDEIEFTVNYSSQDLTANIIIEDEIPDGLTFVENSISSNPESDCSYSNGVVSCESAEASGYIKYKVTVDTSGSYTNTANLTSGEESDSCSTTISTGSLVTCKSKTADKKVNIEPEDIIKYTINYEVENGPTTLNVEDTIPQYMTVLDSSTKPLPDGCSVSSDKVVCEIEIEEETTSGTLVIYMQVDDTLPSQSIEITNTVTMWGADGSKEQGSTATETITTESSVAQVSSGTQVPNTGVVDGLLNALVFGSALIFGGWSIHLFNKNRYE